MENCSFPVSRNESASAPFIHSKHASMYIVNWNAGSCIDMYMVSVCIRKYVHTWPCVNINLIWTAVEVCPCLPGHHNITQSYCALDGKLKCGCAYTCLLAHSPLRGTTLQNNIYQITPMYAFEALRDHSLHSLQCMFDMAIRWPGAAQILFALLLMLH